MIVIDYNTLYHTTNYGDYKIIQNLGYLNNDSRLWIRIKFILTGYEKDIRYDYIGHDIQDPYYPRIYGVACMGEINVPRSVYKPDYDRWIHMISRCYNQLDSNYERYGGLGIRVSNEWLVFANYYNDIKNLPGYRFRQQYPYQYHLDKDYLQQDIPDNQTIYSKDTCIWIDRSINSKLANSKIFTGEVPYIDKYGNLKMIEMVKVINNK